MQGHIVYTAKPKKKMCKGCENEFLATMKYNGGYHDYCGFCRTAHRQDEKWKRRKKGKFSINLPKQK